MVVRPQGQALRGRPDAEFVMRSIEPDHLQRVPDLAALRCEWPEAPRGQSERVIPLPCRGPSLLFLFVYLLPNLFSLGEIFNLCLYG